MSPFRKSDFAGNFNPFESLSSCSFIKLHDDRRRKKKKRVRFGQALGNSCITTSPNCVSIVFSSERFVCGGCVKG